MPLVDLPADAEIAPVAAKPPLADLPADAQLDRGWGDTAADAGRFLMTAGVRGVGGAIDALTDPLAPLRRLISPDLERLEQSGRPHPGEAAGDAAFAATGVPEYKPTSPLGRIGLATAEGGVAGGPMGVGAAALAALSGAMGQGTQEATGNERLATAAGLAPGLAAGGIAAIRGRAPEVPSATALRDAGAAGYDAVRASGLEINPTAVSDLAVRLQNDLTRQGFGSAVAPTTHSILDTIANPPALPAGATRVATINDIMALRQNLGNVSGSRQDATAGGQARRAVDDFLSSVDPADITAPKSTAQIIPNPGGGFDIHTNGPWGVLYATDMAQAQSMAAKYGGGADPAAIAKTYGNANANYAAAQRSNALTGELSRADTGVIERAENQAAAGGSGQNLDNAIRQRTRSIIQDPSAVAGFSTPEIEALRNVVNGGWVQNRLRDYSNITGGGRGLGAAFAGLMSGFGSAPYVGGLKGTLIGASIPLSGSIAKTLENSMSRRQLNRADELVRSRSPLAEELASLPQPSRAGAAFSGLLPSLLAPPPRRGLLDY